MEISNSADPLKGALIALSRGSPPLRIGEMLEATVLSGTPEARIGGRAVIRVAHHSLEVRSQLSLLKGDRLVLKVTQLGSGLQLTVQALNGTAPDPAADPLQAHLARLQPLQGGYGVLLAALAALPRSEIASLLPEGPRALLERLLAGIRSRQDLTRPEALRAAIRDAGLFLEARLELGEALAQHDLKAALLRLMGALDRSPTGTNGAGTACRPLAPRGDPPPPTPRAAPLAQPRARLQIAEALEALGTPRTLYRLLEGVLARMTLHQLATLESAEAGHPSWLLELPLRDAHRLDLMHMRIGQESQPPKGEGQPQWSAELALDLPGLGPVQVRIGTDGQRVSAVFWVQQPCTAQAVEAALGSLRDRLVKRGLRVDALACRRGPAPESPHRAGGRQVIDTRA